MRCPRCKNELQQSGTLDVEGQEWAVYQCDQCTTPWEFEGEKYDTALTFAVDASGRMFSPETLEPLNLN